MKRRGRWTFEGFAVFHEGEPVWWDRVHARKLPAEAVCVRENFVAEANGEKPGLFTAHAVVATIERTPARKRRKGEGR